MLNKTDRADPDTVKQLLAAHPGSLARVGRDGRGRRRAARGPRPPAASARAGGRADVPYDRGDVLAALHREGEVLVEVHEESGTRIRARLPEASVTRFREFAVAP